jgi:hypothetical protein
MTNCNEIPIHVCLTDCLESACHVRDLRLSVQNTDIENMVELALEEHWQTAYEAGINDSSTVLLD